MNTPTAVTHLVITVAAPGEKGGVRRRLLHRQGLTPVQESVVEALMRLPVGTVAVFTTPSGSTLTYILE